METFFSYWSGIKNTLLYLWHTACNMLEGIPFVKYIDPSLFQNVVMVVVAIFVPYAIVFLSDIKNKKGNTGRLENMIFNKTLFQVKPFLWISICVVFLFSISKDEQNTFPIELKLFSIFVLLAFVILSLFLFHKLWRFSEGEYFYFYKKFFKTLSHKKQEKFLHAWKFYWGEKHDWKEEKEIFDIFIEKIDDLFRKKEYFLATESLESFRTCLSNREKHPYFDFEIILKKSLSWHKSMYEDPKSWQAHNKTEKGSIQKIMNKVFKDKNALFWQWEYFQKAFLKDMILELLKEHDHYTVIKILKTHFQEEISSKDQYIRNMVGIFCDPFFRVYDTESTESIPDDWKITKENLLDKKNIIPNIFFYEFLKFFREAKDKKLKKNEFQNENLNRIIQEIFPHIDFIFFCNLLEIITLSDINDIKKKRTYGLIYVVMSWEEEKIISKDQTSETLDIVMLALVNMQRQFIYFLNNISEIEKVTKKIESFRELKERIEANDALKKYITDSSPKKSS